MSSISKIFNEQSIVIENNEFFSKRSLTDVQIKKIACAALAGTLIAGAGTLTVLAITGGVAWPLALAAIPMVAASVGIIYSTRQWKDYENPQELQKMRDKAANSTFSEILKEHGLTRITKYQIVSLETLQSKFAREHEFISFSELTRKLPLATIRNYNLMPLPALRQKFAKEVEAIDLPTFLNRFSLNDLHQYQVLDGKVFLKLHALGVNFKSSYEDLSLAQRKLDRKYPQRQESLLSQLKEEERDVRYAMRQELMALDSELSYELSRIHSRQVDFNRMLSSQLRGIEQRRQEVLFQKPENMGFVLEQLRQEENLCRANSAHFQRQINADVAYAHDRSYEQKSARSALGQAHQFHLDTIARRRQEILDRKIGLIDQSNYEQELKQINAAHKKELDKFIQEFEKTKPTL